MIYFFYPKRHKKVTHNLDIKGVDIMVKAKLLAANDHRDLQDQLNNWLQKTKPHITNITLVADGAEYIYTILIVYS